LQNKTQYGTDNGTIDPSCNMPTPTIRSRRGSNVRFHKGDEMTPEAHTTYRPGRLVYTRYAATIQILLTQSVISTSICYFYKFYQWNQQNSASFGTLDWLSRVCGSKVIA